MGQAEIRIFVILTGIVVLVFATGIIVFLFQYRQRRLTHEKEKQRINEQHEIDILNTQLDSQQQTMQHIGQEIHDSVAQKITLASIYTQRMEFEARDQEEKNKLAGISKILNDSLVELRQLSRNLTDKHLRNEQLGELIRMECEQVNATGVCSASSIIEEIPAISIAAKSSLLRVVQEFIQNSIKHSGCSEINIKLLQQNGNIRLVLEDDGKGFEMDNLDHAGIGLDSIRRRIQGLGGEHKFETRPGSGVRLELTIPINPLKAGT